MNRVSDLQTITEQWGDEIINMYQSCYRQECSWSDYLDTAIVTVLDELAKLKTATWEK